MRNITEMSDRLPRYVSLAVLAVPVIAVVIASVVFVRVRTLDRESFDEAVVATVNDVAITEQQLRDRIIEAFPEFTRDSPTPESTLQTFAERLIEEELLLGYARANNLTVDETDLSRIDTVLLDAQSEEVSSSLFHDDKDRRLDLQRRGLIQAAQRHLMQNARPPTEEEIRRWYELNQEQFLNPGYSIVRRIVVTDYREAVSIKSQLSYGADFALLAEDLSITKDAVNAGLIPKISDDRLDSLSYGPIIRELRIGQVSSVVDTPIGYQLFRVEERHAPTVAPLQSVEMTIRERLHRKAGREQLRAWIQAEKNKATIRRNPHFFHE